MTIKAEKTENGILLEIEGRIDTLTSPELQEEILKAFQKSDRLLLDFKMVEYISSAGLRALLVGEKTAKSKGGSMRIENIAPSIADVFKVTGFDNILTIR